jgi:long-subunit fatty acid transport protein
LRDGSLTSLVPYQQGVDQLRSVQQKGGITELAFSLGGNYQEKLLIGATLGIPILSYRSSSTLSEQTTNPNSSDSFDHFNYNEDLKVTGAGVNLKLGMIYKFNDYFRMGVAFHTPTFYGLSEVYNRSLLNDSKNFAGINQIVAPENQYDYQVVTPFKAVVSATGMLGQYGFVSVDYEYVNYASMRYYMDDKNQQNDVNSSIKMLYKSASNIRAGLELRFDQLMVRGGVGFHGTPFKDDYYQSNRTDISGGLGYRFDNVFVDFAIIHSAYSFHEQPYDLPVKYYTQPSSAAIDTRQTTAVLTFGVKM